MMINLSPKKSPAAVLALGMALSLPPAFAGTSPEPDSPTASTLSSASQPSSDELKAERAKIQQEEQEILQRLVVTRLPGGLTRFEDKKKGLIADIPDQICLRKPNENPGFILRASDCRDFLKGDRSEKSLLALFDKSPDLLQLDPNTRKTFIELLPLLHDWQLMQYIQNHKAVDYKCVFTFYKHGQFRYSLPLDKFNRFTRIAALPLLFHVLLKRDCCIPLAEAISGKFLTRDEIPELFKQTYEMQEQAGRDGLSSRIPRISAEDNDDTVSTLAFIIEGTSALLIAASCYAAWRKRCAIRDYIRDAFHMPQRRGFEVVAVNPDSDDKKDTAGILSSDNQ